MRGYVKEHQRFKESLRKVSVCPFLQGLKLATIEGMLKVCEARRKENRLSVKRKQNSIESSTGTKIEESLIMNKWVCCVRCLYYRDLKKGILPNDFRNIHIIKQDQISKYVSA